MVPACVGGTSSALNATICDIQFRRLLPFDLEWHTHTLFLYLYGSTIQEA